MARVRAPAVPTATEAHRRSAVRTAPPRPRPRAAMNPVSVRRSLYADRWVPRYYRALLKAMNRHAREYAGAVDAGMVPNPPVLSWAQELVNIKELWVYPVVVQGWDVAEAEVAWQARRAGKHADVHAGAARADLWAAVAAVLAAKARAARRRAVPEGYAPPGPEEAFGREPFEGPVTVGKPAELTRARDSIKTPGSFLLEGRFEDIDRWIETTSNAEAVTEASNLRDAFTAAAASRDPETGAAWTPRQMAKHIEATAKGTNKARAAMLARTGTIWAMNEGAQQRYRASGITAMRWVTVEDDARCPWCFRMDGRVVRTDDPFFPAGSEFGVRVPGGPRGGLRTRTLRLPFEVQHPPLHPNCLVGETPVLSPDKVAGFVAAYSGPVVEVALADSRRLTITPNHMLLTPQGFARAASLREGDDVVDGLALQRIVTSDIDDDCEPALIRDVVQSFAKSGSVSTASVPVSPEYLHGDASFCHGEIDVVAPNSLLRSDMQSAQFKGHGELPLFRTDVVLALLDGNSDFASVLLGAVRGTSARTSRYYLVSAALSALGRLADGGMGGRREGTAFCGRESCHAELVRFADGTYSDARACKVSTDTTTRDAKRLGQTEFRLPGLVPTTKVVGLHVRQLSSHVYDLQSLSGLYIANGVVSSNCRCTVIPIVTREQAVEIMPPLPRPKHPKERAGTPKIPA